MSVSAPGFVREGEGEDHGVYRDVDKKLPPLRVAGLSGHGAGSITGGPSPP